LIDVLVEFSKDQRLIPLVVHAVTNALSRFPESYRVLLDLLWTIHFYPGFWPAFSGKCSAAFISSVPLDCWDVETLLKTFRIFLEPSPALIDSLLYTLHRFPMDTRLIELCGHLPHGSRLLSLVSKAFTDLASSCAVQNQRRPDLGFVRCAIRATVEYLKWFPDLAWSNRHSVLAMAYRTTALDLAELNIILPVLLNALCPPRRKDLLLDLAVGFGIIIPDCLVSEDRAFWGLIKRRSSWIEQLIREKGFAAQRQLRLLSLYPEVMASRLQFELLKGVGMVKPSPAPKQGLGLDENIRRGVHEVKEKSNGFSESEAWLIRTDVVRSTMGVKVSKQAIWVDTVGLESCPRRTESEQAMEQGHS
jgi:hypothetical protein